MGETKHTFCRLCEAACGLEVTVENNRITNIAPDAQHPASEGFMCIKGARFGDLQSSPDRLTTPLKRVGDKFEPIDWDTALREIGQKLKSIRKAHGPNSIALYVGFPAPYNFSAGLMQNAFVDGVGTKSIYGAGSQDCINKFAVQQHMYGSAFRMPFPDLLHTMCFIGIGSNPAVSQMTFVQSPNAVKRLKDIEERGGRVVWVNPRRTETAKVVGEHVPIRPDTDVFFLLSFLRDLIAQGGVQEERVAQYMRGLKDIKRLAEPWTPERTQEVTGIAPEVLRDLVSSYLAADGATLYCGTGINQGKNGTIAFWILEVINAISGNLDKEGGSIVGEGLIDMAAFLKKQGKLERKDRTRIGNLPSVADTFPAAVLADEILTPGEGQVRALINFGGNPVLSVPGSGNKLDVALKDLDLLVCLDLFRNETGNLAHYILPTTTFMERADLPMVLHWMGGQQPIRYVQYTDKVVEPPEGVRDEAWIFRELTRAMGVDMFGAKPLSMLFGASDMLSKLPIIGQRMKITPELMMMGFLRGIKGAAPIAEQRTKYKHGQLLAPNTADNFLGKRVLTADKLVQLAPEHFLKLAEESLAGVFERERQQRHEIKLVSKRERLSLNTWMHNLTSFVGDKRPTNYLYMNPEDGKERGIVDGSTVIVESAVGKLSIPVKLTDEMMRGSAALPHGWGHQQADGLKVAQRHPGVNVNVLTPLGVEAADPLSGMSHLTGIVVRVRPALEAQVGTKRSNQAEASA